MDRREVCVRQYERVGRLCLLHAPRAIPAFARRVIDDVIQCRRRDVVDDVTLPVAGVDELVAMTTARRRRRLLQQTVRCRRPFLTIN